MKYNFIILLLTTIILGSCQEKSHIKTKRLFVDLDKVEPEISIDEYIDSTFYEIIPLSHTEQPIGVISKMKVVNDTIFIFDEQTMALNVFTNRGVNILSLNKVGRARNEYLEILDFDYSDGIIYIVDNIKMAVMEYNLQGDYIKSIDATKYWINKIFVLNNDIYLINDESETESGNYSLFQLNPEGELKHKGIPFNGKKRQNSSLYCTARTGEKVLYGQRPDNIIYEIFDANVSDIFSLDFGKYNMPKDYWKMNARDLIKNNLTDKYAYGLSQFFVSGKYIFFYVDDKDLNSILIIYNNETDSIEHVTKGFDMDNFKFYSNLSSPIIIDGYLYNPKDYDDLKNSYIYLSKYQLESTSPKYLEDIKKVLEKRGSNSNPIIIKYKFK